MSKADRITILVGAGAIATAILVGFLQTAGRFGSIDSQFTTAASDRQSIRAEISATADSVRDMHVDLAQRLARIEATLGARSTDTDQ